VNADSFVDEDGKTTEKFKIFEDENPYSESEEEKRKQLKHYLSEKKNNTISKKPKLEQKLSDGSLSLFNHTNPMQMKTQMTQQTDHHTVSSLLHMQVMKMIQKMTEDSNESEIKIKLNEHCLIYTQCLHSSRVEK